MVAGSVEHLPEDERVLIRAAVERINDIANSLLSRERPKGRVLESVSVTRVEAEGSSLSSQVGVILIPSLLDAVVSEKRAQYRDRRTVTISVSANSQDYGLFAVAQERELKRILSNLINNAIEALPGAGQVTVTAVREGNPVAVYVQDSGRGIPADVLPKLGARGETHGKANGSGLGPMLER
jgi:signal transduction histidine kinase